MGRLRARARRSLDARDRRLPQPGRPLLPAPRRGRGRRRSGGVPREPRRLTGPLPRRSPALLRPSRTHRDPLVPSSQGAIIEGAMTLYHEGSRRLQDRFDTRRLADRIDERLVRDTIDDDDRAFIEARDMFFIATADEDGRPQCSYKGGDPGFVRVLDEQTIAFPCYDGNGMYLSMGNALVNTRCPRTTRRRTAARSDRALLPARARTTAA